MILLQGEVDCLIECQMHRSILLPHRVLIQRETYQSATSGTIPAATITSCAADSPGI
jgi:hypothetical protein